MRDDTKKTAARETTPGVDEWIFKNSECIIDDLGSFSTTAKFFLRTTLVSQYLLTNKRKDGLPEN